MEIIGHRGAPELAPENTLASFAKALELGVDAIELDVHLSAEGHVVVLHDATVNRTTDGKGAVKDLRLREIKRLDAGAWFGPEYAGERIPRLEEVFELVGERSALLIELKFPRWGVYPDLVPRLVKQIRARKAESRVRLQSFEPRYIRHIASCDPDLCCGPLLAWAPAGFPLYRDRRLHLQPFKPLKATDWVGVSYSGLSRAFVDRCHEAGLAVGAYTVNPLEAMQRMASLGVDHLITDDPGGAIERLKGG